MLLATSLLSCKHPPEPWDVVPTADTSWSLPPPDTSSPALEPPSWSGCADLRSISLMPAEDTSWHNLSEGEAGTIDLIGTFGGSLTLGAGEPSEITLTPVGESASLVARYHSDGSLSWVRALDGTDQAEINAAAPAPGGGLYIVGSGDGLSSFVAGQPVGGAGESDAFIARILDDGQIDWLRSLGSPGDDHTYAVAAVQDGIYVAGTYGGDLSFGQDPDGAVSLPEGADTAAFFAKYTPEGELVWVTPLGGATSTSISYLSYDEASQSVAIQGTLSGGGATIFGENTPEQHILAPEVIDSFLALYDADGSFRWVTSVGRSYSRGVSRLPSGDLLASGQTFGDAIFDRGGPAEQSLPADTYSAWNARYNLDGQLAWVSAVTASSITDRVDAQGVVGLPDGRSALLVSVGGSALAGQVAFETGFSWSAALVVVDADGAHDCALQIGVGDFFDQLWLSNLVVRSDGGIDLVGWSVGEILLDEDVSLSSSDTLGLRLTLDLVER